MRTWTRLPYEKLCGQCSRPIYREQPLQVITMTGVERRLYRCAECADGPVPTDLPLVETTPAIGGLPSLARDRWWDR
jgi:hypothetical protein